MVSRNVISGKPARSVGQPSRVTSAVSPVDPPLTYILTVYDREPGRLVPDGTIVMVTRGGRERERLGLPPGGPCGQAKVVAGRAELRVEITPVS